jgi:hypothetical protein
VAKTIEKAEFKLYSQKARRAGRRCYSWGGAGRNDMLETCIEATVLFGSVLERGSDK